MIHNVEQRTDAWKRLRLGRPTASEYDKLRPPHAWVKKKEGDWLTKEGRDYLYKLVAERLMDAPTAREYVSADMREGAEHEQPASDAFEETYGCKLGTIGFADTLPDPGGPLCACCGKPLGRTGCSPDRFIVGRPAIVEIKSPRPLTHVRYLIEGPGEDYDDQCQGQMWCGGWEFCHFWSWRPERRQNGQPALPPYTLVKTRDEAAIKALQYRVERFCDRLDGTTEKVRQRGLVATLRDGELRLEEPA